MSAVVNRLVRSVYFVVKTGMAKKRAKRLRKRVFEHGGKTFLLTKTQMAAVLYLQQRGKWTSVDDIRKAINYSSRLQWDVFRNNQKAYTALIEEGVNDCLRLRPVPPPPAPPVHPKDSDEIFEMRTGKKRITRRIDL